MSSSTDQRPNPAPTPHTNRKNETVPPPPHRNAQKRSSSWSQYHSRHSSNPFFLSRRAREQGSLVRERKLERKSGTFGDMLSSPEVRDNISLAAKPHILHIAGISEEVAPGDFLGHQKKDVSQRINTHQSQTETSEKDGTEKSVDPDLRKAIDISPEEKNTVSIGNRAFPQASITAPAHSTNSACYSVNLLDDRPLHQNLPRKEGTVRRKTMRTVSHEDYLLARGANPRTGIVTPSLHSGSSSIDDQELLRNRDLPQHAKWRLKGDQWVSLSLDEPSPLPSPPSEPSVRRPGKLLRIPPKLAPGRPKQDTRHVHSFEQHRMDGLPAKADKVARVHQTGQKTEIESANPEGKQSHIQAITTPARLLPTDHERSGKDTVIRRKPLGTPPRMQSAEHLFHNNDLHEASTETVITKTVPVEQARSSSMPTPRKIRYFRPEDVGKALPALPGPKTSDHGDVKEESPSQSVPFLGLQPGDWIEDVSNRVVLNGCDSGEKLPCPPTNDIQFQSHRSERTNMKKFPLRTIPTQNYNFESQHRRVNFAPHTDGRRSTLARSRPMIPPRHYQSAQLMHTEQEAGQRNTMKIREASQPTPLQTRPQGQPTSKSGQMIMRRPRPEAGSNARTSPSTITPTTTPTTTVQTLPEDRLVSSSWREIPSPQRLGQQRASTTPRPAMPERAEGTHNFPQVSPQKESPGRYQWRMTGTSDSGISANGTSMEGSPERDLIPRPLRPSNGNTAGPGRPRDVPAKGVTDTDQTTRNCPRCQEPSLGGRRHNMHGFTHTQGNQLAENIDPQVDLSFASGFLQGPPQDHSACCSECCAVGCHGSCLGHKSASRTASTSGFAGGLGATKEAFRNSMKLSRRIRIRTSAGGSRETETEDIAELETPMSWEVGGPVSLGLPCKMNPQDFWGGGNTKDGSQGKRVASNASASSVKSVEMPTNASIGTIIEALIVPFGASKMWLKKHPQLLALMQMIMVKLLDMSKHVLDTTGKAYRVAYIYSKTGRFSPGKHTSLSGFVRDCVKALVYCLVLGAMAMVVGRVLAVFAGAGSWLFWALSWVVWVVKAAGLGILW